jgi:hypothetical protein
VIETMERETGIEPVTSSLGSWRSTAELLPLTVRQANHYTPVPFPLRSSFLCNPVRVRPKPKPDFRLLPISTADSILAVSNPHQIKVLPLDCSTMKLCPSGTNHQATTVKLFLRDP